MIRPSLIARFASSLKISIPSHASITASSIGRSSSPFRMFSSSSASTTSTLDGSEDDIASTLVIDHDLARKGTKMSGDEIRSKFQSFQQSSDAITLEKGREMIELLRRIRDFSSSLEVFTGMKAAGIEPDASCYTDLVCSGIGGLHNAEIIYLVTGNHATMQTTQSTLFDAVSHVFTLAKEARIKFKVDLYAAACSIILRRGSYFAVTNIMQIISACELNGVDSNVIMENSLLTAISRSKFNNNTSTNHSISSLDDQYQRIVSKKLNDTHTDYIYLNGLFNQDRVEDAVKFFNDKVKPEVATKTSVAHNILIQGFLKRKDPKQALEYLEDLTSEKYSGAYDPVTFNLLLGYFTREDNLAELESLFKIIEKTGTEHTSVYHAAKLKAYALKGDALSAIGYLKNLHSKDLMKTDSCVYNEVLRFLPNRNIPFQCKQPIVSALVNGHCDMPENGIISKHISSLTPNIQNVIFSMETHGPSPNASTVEVVLALLVSKREFGSVIKIFENLKESGLKMRSPAFNFYMYALYQMKEFEKFRAFYTTELRKSGYRLSPYNYNAVKSSPELSDLLLPRTRRPSSVNENQDILYRPEQ